MSHLTHIGRISKSKALVISPPNISAICIHKLRKLWKQGTIKHIEVFYGDTKGDAKHIDGGGEDLPHLYDILHGACVTKIASTLNKKKGTSLLIEPFAYKHSQIKTAVSHDQSVASLAKRAAALEKILNLIDLGVKGETSQELSVVEMTVVSDVLPGYLDVLSKDPNSMEAFSIARSLMDRLNPVNEEARNRVQHIIAETVTTCAILFPPKDINATFNPHGGSRQGRYGITGGEKIWPDAATHPEEGSQ